MKSLSLAFTAVAALLLVGCDGPQYAESATQTEQRVTRATQSRLITAVPMPNMQTSLERFNVAKRLTRLNQNNMHGFIYLLSHGSVMASYPVKGKASSLNSYLAGKEQILNDPNGDASAGSVLMESPDLDGTYGENVHGIFFFTADSDAYVEWFGEYLFSDQPLKLNQQPLMIRQIGATQ